MDLKGRAALLTGGARMGAAVGLALARRGARVALAYRGSRAAAERAARDIRRDGGQALALRADLARGADVQRLIGRVRAAFGGPHVLVHMASRFDPAPWPRLTAAEGPALWARALSVDLDAAYQLARLAAPGMRATGGRIILFSDWTAASGRPRYRGYLPYHVAKAGAAGLAQALALELAPHVLVNAIAPGPILPAQGASRESARRALAATPLRRWGGPEEIAKAVLFLVESDFVTGETLRVDGGRHLY